MEITTPPEWTDEQLAEFRRWYDAHVAREDILLLHDHPFIIIDDPLKE